MMTSSNENISALLALCAGNSPVTGEFPSQRPVTRSFDAFFDLRLNKQFSKQRWRSWFETPSRSLWRHCNDSRPSRLPHRHLGNRLIVTVLAKKWRKWVTTLMNSNDNICPGYWLNRSINVLMLIIITSVKLQSKCTASRWRNKGMFWWLGVKAGDFWQRPLISLVNTQRNHNIIITQNDIALLYYDVIVALYSNLMIC